MGMDIYGKAPKNKKGEYFRNNWWWWRPTWGITYDLCKDILSEDDFTGGNMNDGYMISLEKTEKMADRLDREIENGNLAREVHKFQAANRAAAKKNKKKGLKLGDDGFDFTEDYFTNMANMRGWVEFVRNSGGLSFY